MNILTLPDDMIVEIAMALEDKCDYLPFPLICKATRDISRKIIDRKIKQLDRWIVTMLPNECDMWAKSGRKRYEHEVNSKGEKHGILINYFTSEGNISDIIHYKNGLTNGPYQNFYKDGKVRSQGNNLNGKLLGKEIIYAEHDDPFIGKPMRTNHRLTCITLLKASDAPPNPFEGIVLY